MKQTIMMVLLMATPAAPAMGNSGMPAPTPSASKVSALARASQDPLTRQIIYQQLTKPNGGITAAVRIASGQSVALQLPDLDAKPAEELKDALNSGPGDPLSGLKPAAGLITVKKLAVPANGSKALKPSEQLNVIHKSRKDWGEAGKAGTDKLP
jgi:hypothetical protein